MSPVQHFWALSIQGQFYVVWLALFAVVGLLVVRTRRDPRVLLAAALGVVAVGSFAFSVFLTARNQPLAYFHTGTRMWEFAAGGLLALALPRLTALRRLPAWAGAAAGWAGLALIISCGLVITVSSSFPGWIALWPVTGALLVILAGDGPGATGRWSSTRVLGSRPFVFLGGVSYPADRPPARLRRGGDRRRGLPGRRRDGARVRVPGDDDVPFAPNLLQAQTDRPLVFGNGCHQELAGEDGAGTDGAAELARALEDERCAFGDPDGEVTAVLVGGSHAAQWFPALRVIAEDRGWHLVSATKSGCRFSADPQGDHDEGRSCAAWNEAALRALVAQPPDLVFTTSTVTGPAGEHVEDGFVAYWRLLTDAGIEVVAIRDTPRWTSSPLELRGDQHRRPLPVLDAGLAFDGGGRSHRGPFGSARRGQFHGPHRPGLP